MAITKNAVKTLKLIFLDELVTVYLKGMNVVTVNDDQQQVDITAMAQGYCLDIDQDYIYLGLPDGVITKSISHELAGIIEIEYMGNDLLDADIPLDGDIH